MEAPPPITELLDLAARGDPAASKRVFSLLYDELRRLASAQRMRVRSGDTFNTTAVVHEAYLRLVGRLEVSWNGRQHFFCTAARTMRDVLVDEARRKISAKRGGDLWRVSLDENDQPVATSPEDVLVLDLALQKLEREYPDDYLIVMLRYFTGLTQEEIAETLGIGRRTVQRRWRFCRAWLAEELAP